MGIKITKEVENYLLGFGLSREEIHIYVALLQSGRSSILDLSKKTEVKRSTTHNYVESLIEKGLVSQTSYGGRRMVVAEVPEKLQSLLDQRKWEIQRLENDLPSTVSKLYEMIPQARENSEFEVKYYEGKRGVRSIYSEVLDSKELRSYVNIEKIFELFPENPELFPRAVDKSHLEMWEIIEDSSRSREYVKTVDHVKYRYKFFPKEWDISLFDYMIFDGRIAIITFGDSPQGVLIKSKSIYQNALVLFDMMWGLLPTIEG